MKFFFNIFRRRVMADCGHETLKKDRIRAFGESCKTVIPIVGGKTSYCHRCLEKMAIRCTWCGKAIFIGDPITLFTPRHESFIPPEYAVVHQENPLQLVGCLRTDCADTVADRMGFWYPPGKAMRFTSLLERVRCGGVLSDDVGLA